ncbi:hypothetical protein CYLTODRAFT_449682 [Cylindrobasidium torrendii FP15055 ss-10]|uniref:Uncharacterized protein n=1 Tax=Cylindrobasidium torrendii FP15055 ss-10 TaxID=1314674 RepID=A0A0D7BQM3_9AGAR|nr:hypothetical protein CYLTODRAFT_449682 [Cylindrobasidium torrendii FP15055 ss-10]
MAIAYKANSDDPITNDGAVMQRIPTKRASALSLKDNNVDPSFHHDLCDYGAGVNIHAYISAPSTESLDFILRCPPSTPISNNGSVSLSGREAMLHGLSGPGGGIESSYAQARAALPASEIEVATNGGISGAMDEYLEATVGSRSSRTVSPYAGSRSADTVSSASECGAAVVSPSSSPQPSEDLTGRTIHPLEHTARIRGITLEHLAKEINKRLPAHLSYEAEVVCGRLVYARCSDTDLQIRQEIKLRNLDREVERLTEEAELCDNGYLHEALGRVLAPLLFCYAANLPLDMVYIGLRRVVHVKYDLAVEDILKVLRVNGGDSLVFVYACALVGRLFHFVHADIKLGWYLDCVDVSETFIDILVGAFRIAHGAVHDKLNDERMLRWARFCDGNDGSVSKVEYLWLKALGFQMCVTASEMYKTIDELKTFAEMVASSGGLRPNALSVMGKFWQNALDKLTPEHREGKQTTLEAPEAGTPRMDALQCLLGGLTNGRPLLLRVEDVKVFSYSVGWPGSSKNATKCDEGGKAEKTGKMAVGKLQAKAKLCWKKGARAVRRGLRVQG